MQRIQAYGGQMALFGIRASVRTVFEIARLDQIFRTTLKGRGNLTA